MLVPTPTSPGLSTLLILPRWRPALSSKAALVKILFISVWSRTLEAFWRISITGVPTSIATAGWVRRPSMLLGSVSMPRICSMRPTRKSDIPLAIPPPTPSSPMTDMARSISSGRTRIAHAGRSNADARQYFIIRLITRSAVSKPIAVALRVDDAIPGAYLLISVTSISNRGISATFLICCWV